MTEEATATKESRNGKKPVDVPAGVTIKLDGQTVNVKGKKGELSFTFRPEVEIAQENNTIVVKPREGEAKGVQFQGTTRAVIANMVEGVTEGFTRSLDFRGVGYRAEMNGRTLKMSVGLSHQPELHIPETITVKIEQMDEAGMKFPRVHLESADKALVGQIAARIRSKRPPEPYKGKGVRYTGERIRQKAGKTGK